MTQGRSTTYLSSVTRITCIYLHLLSLFEVLLERVGEALRILDELALPLLEGLLAGAARDVARDLVHRVQQLLDRARDFPAKEGWIEDRLARDGCGCGCGAAETKQ